MGVSDSKGITANSRSSYIDVARGICMICIVLGHQGNPFINRFVFTFHLPVFFIITGYFFNPKTSFKDLVIKRSRGLIIPYFSLALVFWPPITLSAHLFYIPISPT